MQPDTGWGMGVKGSSGVGGAVYEKEHVFIVHEDEGMRLRSALLQEKVCT